MATPTNQSHATFGLLAAPTTRRDIYNQYSSSNAEDDTIMLDAEVIVA